MADRFDRLEALIKKLAADVGELRSEVRSEFRATNKRVDALEDAQNELREDVRDLQDRLGKEIQDLRRIMAASVDAMTSVIRQVAVDKAVETRLRRLETAVFGAKH